MGSSQAGPKIAALLSVVEICRRLKLPVRDYLAAVLPGLADLPIQTPARPLLPRCLGAASLDTCKKGPTFAAPSRGLSMASHQPYHFESLR